MNFHICIRYFYLFIPILFLFPPTTFAATNVTGNIASTTTWTASGSPYVISSNITIDKGATLFINSGVFVKIAKGIGISVAGKISSKGNAKEHIVFTSISDDSDGNDTNGDATTTTAGSVAWGSIYIHRGATADFSYTDLRYGGSPPNYTAGVSYYIAYSFASYEVIHNEGNLSFTDSTIGHMVSSIGISSGGTFTFSHSAIHSAYASTALSLYGKATISNSVFVHNESIELHFADVTFSKTKVADPVIIMGSLVHDGGGNIAPIILDWSNIVRKGTVFLASPFINISPDISVPFGSTLTIAPNAIVKLHGIIDVYGKLISGSVATSTATTTLTSSADDSVGGNTNASAEIKYTKNVEDQCSAYVKEPKECIKLLARIAKDGGTIKFNPAAPDHGWGGIIAEKGSVVNLRNTNVRYAGDASGYSLTNVCGDGSAKAQIMCAGQILNEGGEVFIASSTFTNALYNQIIQDAGTTTISHSRFVSSTRFAYVRGGTLSVKGSSITDESIGIKNIGTNSVDARNNWWGSASGPKDTDTNPKGKGPLISAKVLFTPWLKSNPFAPKPKKPLVSNVLFLPGIEGSRLYEGTSCGGTSEEKLWSPIGTGNFSDIGIVFGSGNKKVEKLSLNTSGDSKCADIYTKVGDVIDSVRGNNIYSSLIKEMDTLKSAGTINDWEPVSYDWRLSLSDILNNGAQHGGKIFYEDATSTPYIEQTLRALAKTSQTGKVTIIAHSNGGLVAKALLSKLGDAEAKKLVDRVIMVAVPQSGTPSDVGSLLVGYGAGLFKSFAHIKNAITIVSNQVARAFAKNSPMAYHLLPSEDYLESTMGDSAHPVIRFQGDGYAKEEKAYGNTIANRVALDDFLLAKSGGRKQPAVNNLHSANILNPTLIKYANKEHSTLDVWEPPSGIKVDEIAGWGVDTVAGIDFYTIPGEIISVVKTVPHRVYRPIFTEDGDGTVTVPSAIMMATSTNVKRYWINLKTINTLFPKNKNKHANLFEIPQLRIFVKNLLENSTSTLPKYISKTRPVSKHKNKQLTFFLHSPLSLQLTDSLGNVTGISTSTDITQNIPGSSSGIFGEVKYVVVPASGKYKLTMHGKAKGSFSLDVQESAKGVVTASSTIANVPTETSTLATLSVSGGIDAMSSLTVDEYGDGKTVIKLTPKIGKTVIYTPPKPVTIQSHNIVPNSHSFYVTPHKTEDTHIAIVTNTVIQKPVVKTQKIIKKPSGVQKAEVVTRRVPKKVKIQKFIPIPKIKHSPKLKPAKTTLVKILHKKAIVPQTASVAGAVSQQSFILKLEEEAYNDFVSFWRMFTQLF